MGNALKKRLKVTKMQGSDFILSGNRFLCTFTLTILHAFAFITCKFTDILFLITGRFQFRYYTRLLENSKIVYSWSEVYFNI